jgi:hypothetical protein
MAQGAGAWGVLDAGWPKVGLGKLAVPEAGAPGAKRCLCKWLDINGGRVLSGLVGSFNLKNYFERPHGPL